MGTCSLDRRTEASGDHGFQGMTPGRLHSKQDTFVLNQLFPPRKGCFQRPCTGHSPLQGKSPKMVVGWKMGVGSLSPYLPHLEAQQSK